jgi:hypothetical protein
MANEFYTVYFESGAATLSTFTVHAESDADAQIKAKRFFEEHPENAPDFSGYDQLTIRVEIQLRVPDSQ